MVYFGTVTATLSDEALVANYARSRDGEALAEVVKRRWDETYRLARRLLGDAAAAEDAAKEAFVLLVRNASSYDASRPFGPWFRTLVLNASRKRARARRARERHERVAREARPLASEPEAERALLDAELHEHLERLPEKLRSPVVLHFFEGWSYDEVAAATGAPRTTIQSRIKSGLDRLRESLAGAGATCSIAELGAWLGRAGSGAPSASPPPPRIERLETLARRAGLARLLVLGAA